MQEQKTGGRAGDTFLSPTRALLAVGAIAATVFGLWLVGDPAAEGTSTSSAADAASQQSPQEDEPVEIFRRLYEAHHLAYRHRDVTLIEEIYVPGTEVSRLAHSTIERLLRDRVLDRSVYEIQSLQLLETTPKRIVVDEQTKITPHFVAESGKDVTSEQATETLQHSKWTLRFTNGSWLITDILITDLKGTK